MIWLVGLMNVVNFSDGVDGLAAGLCAIDGIAFAIIVFDLPGGTTGAAVLAALTAGAALGFLFHNFPPASVFMGDSGANLLGYLLGVVAVIGSLKTGAVVALVVPLIILAVPFLDTGFVIAKRLKYRRKPWSADANHFHHRMARIGFSQRKTVAYLYGWTFVSGGAGGRARQSITAAITALLAGRCVVAISAAGGGGERLPRLRARDPQVPQDPRATELRDGRLRTRASTRSTSGCSATSRPASSTRVG